jgi:hypothetical protein
MHEIIIVYFSIALATSIVSWWFMFRPLVREAIQAGVINDITRSPKLSSVVFILLNTLMAPIILPIVFIPSMFESARAGMRRAINED